MKLLHKFLVNLAVFILLETVSLILISHSSAVMRSSLGIVIGSMQGSIGTAVTNIRSYFSLREQNEELYKSNFSLTKALLDMASDSTAHAARRDGRNFGYTRASVIRNSYGKQHNFFIINAGEADGVKEGDGIITAQGALGIVEMVGSRYSKVISFTNRSMAVSARLRRDGPTGALVWNGLRSNGANLLDIPPHITVEAGDTVFTSGFSGIFPADLPLGTVKSRNISRSGANQMEITLFEDFSSIREVLVANNRDHALMEEVLDESEQEADLP